MFDVYPEISSDGFKTPRTALMEEILEYLSLIFDGVIEAASENQKFTLPETKMMVSNRNLLFQGCIFRCYVSFKEGKLPTWISSDVIQCILLE